MYFLPLVIIVIFFAIPKILLLLCSEHTGDSFEEGLIIVYQH